MTTSSPRDTGDVHPRYRLDREFYDRVRAARPSYRLVDRTVIPPFSGAGMVVKRGHAFRVVDVDGPQVADVAFWSADDPREAFRQPRTFAIEGWMVRPYTRLWSDVPWFRPLATCIDDTVVLQPPTDGWHHHAAIGAHCAPEMYEFRSGRTGLNGCHQNFLQAIQPFNMGEEHIGDNLNVHQKRRVDPVTGRCYVMAGDARPGDYIEFYAEVDLLVAVSACPCGDGGASGSRQDEIPQRPVALEVHDTGVPSRAFPPWTDWRRTWGGRWTPPSP